MVTEKTRRTHKPTLVYWAVGITALIGFAFLFWPKDQNNIVLRGTVNLSQEGREHVNGYLIWAERATIKDMDISHEFASLGLHELSGALRGITESTSDRATAYSRSRIAKIDQAAAQIAEKPQSMEHSDVIKEAFLATHEVLSFLQKGIFLGLSDHIQALEKQISSLKEEEQFMNQKGEILETHKQIAAIMRVMTKD